MTVCLLVLWGDSLTFTLASALTYCGHKVDIYVADSERHFRAAWGTAHRIASIPGVTVVTEQVGQLTQSYDRLIVQGHPLLLNYGSLLNGLAEKAEAITAVSSGDRSRDYKKSLKLQAKELKWFGPYLKKIGRVAYKDGFYRVDLFGLLKSRRVVGFDSHSKFLLDASLFKALHANDWKAYEERPIRVNFMGSRDPVSRGRILDGIEDIFVSPELHGSRGHRMLWHAYTDATPTALSQIDFLMNLTNSDFTLSPPGYSLVTHRPVEALLRGSIPVLNESELDLYDLGLKDSVNCIAVKSGRWRAAMDRILGMTYAEIIAIRHQVQVTYVEQARYETLARRMCERLGVEPDQP